MAEFDVQKRLLHWYAIFVAASVLVLICSGGLVTSHGAGMAVPDWPNSFGYNMFLFPVSRWVGGVFFEHTHRLIASGVGLLTIVLCVLTVIIEDRLWVKWLTGIAVIAVIVQGVLGGLRVTEHNAVLGLFHGCLAQGFFSLVATVALVTSRFWRGIKQASNERDIRSLRFWTIVVTVNAVYSAGAGSLDAPLAHGSVDSRFSNRLRADPSADRCRVGRQNQRGSYSDSSANFVGSYSIAVRSSSLGCVDRGWPYLGGDKDSSPAATRRPGAFCRRFLARARSRAIRLGGLDGLE